MQQEQIVIIGGGPAGLAAAVYLARAFLKPLVIAGAVPGGQLMLTSDVENYPGFESILGPDLVQKYRTHAEKFGTRFINDNVATIESTQTSSIVMLSSGQTLKAKTLLITTGADAKWLGLDSEQRLRGRGVSACATCDGFFFKEKVVAVVGGGDTAMEEALTLTKYATKVYIIHRGSEFRASQIMQKRVLEHNKITILWKSEVIDVLGQDRVDGVQIKTEDAKTKKQLASDMTIKVDGLFMAIGHIPNTDFLKGSGVLLDQKGYIKTAIWTAWEEKKNLESRIPASQRGKQNSEFEYMYQLTTNIPGVFAAGDCVDYVYRQAATAVGMGVAAALDVERYLAKVTSGEADPQTNR